MVHLQLGILQKARYISSNSGGSWANSAFSYSQIPIDQFTGPYIAPQDLNLNAAENPQGRLSQILANSNLNVFGVYSAQNTAGLQDPLGSWAATVKVNFLDPLGLGTTTSSVTMEGTAGNVAAGVQAKVPQITYYTAGNQNKPMPIIVSTIFANQDPVGIYPFEHSPLYFGLPALNAAGVPIAFGDGYVEPLGFNSPPPISPPTTMETKDKKQTPRKASDNTQPRKASDKKQARKASVLLHTLRYRTVSVQPDYIVPLTGFVAASSAFFTAATNPQIKPQKKFLGDISWKYWNLYDFKGAQLSFTDGGLTDNMGIMPLLRRGVTDVIAMRATQALPSSTAEAFAAADDTIASLYGAAPDAETNRKLKVFETSQYVPLFDQHRANYLAGRAPFVQQTLNVSRVLRKAPASSHASPHAVHACFVIGSVHQTSRKLQV
eukprot:jgi/Chrzof1/10620/Cz05g05140.t1